MKEFRLLVINECNYSCYFCHKEGNQYSNFGYSLNADDYVTLYKIGRDYFGYKTVNFLDN